MLDGRLAPYLGDEDGADKLSYALKIVINIVYGLTSAKFNNPFRDIRNVDNIVAKRGALFMIDLKHALQKRGVQVVHIKTDSVKIPNATPDTIKFVTEFGEPGKPVVCLDAKTKNLDDYTVSAAPPDKL